NLIPSIRQFSAIRRLYSVKQSQKANRRRDELNSCSYRFRTRDSFSRPEKVKVGQKVGQPKYKTTHNRSHFVPSPGTLRNTAPSKKKCRLVRREVCNCSLVLNPVYILLSKNSQIAPFRN